MASVLNLWAETKRANNGSLCLLPPIMKVELHWEMTLLVLLSPMDIKFQLKREIERPEKERLD